MLHECATTALRLSVTPTLMRGLELVLARPNSNDPAKLAALQKPVELLHVRAKTMVVTDHNHASRFFRSRKNVLYALGIE